MKTVILCLLICWPLFSFGAEVHRITAETTRMSEDTLKKRFQLKEGDLFSEQTYEKAKQDLQNNQLFRTLEFLYKERHDGIDIHIKADDRTYIVPLFLAFSNTKRSAGISLLSGNLFKQGETAFVSVNTSKDGFNTNGGFSIGKHSFEGGYQHLSFNQRFYANGWTSSPGMFISVEDENRYNEFLLGEVHTRQDNAYLSYRYQISSIWSVFVTPEYEYYNYQNHVLDTGNHSHISFGAQYADDVDADTTMKTLAAIRHVHKAQMLRDLPRVRHGKLADITYISGGHLTGSDYDIQKVLLGGAYLWEMKAHHRLAVFAKAQRALHAPFSSQIQSSDLLFGLGIYDREQRGKGGFSAGISFTYFVVRNQTGLLTLMPFYEQAYVTSSGHSYQPHSGIGAVLEYRLWRIPLPVSLNFTQNVNDGSHHIGLKIGGHF